MGQRSLTPGACRAGRHPFIVPTRTHPAAVGVPVLVHHLDSAGCWPNPAGGSMSFNASLVIAPAAPLLGQKRLGHTAHMWWPIHLLTYSMVLPLPPTCESPVCRVTGSHFPNDCGTTDYWNLDWQNASQTFPSVGSIFSF